MRLGVLASLAVATACSDSKLERHAGFTRSVVARRGGPIEQGIVGGERHGGHPEVPFLALRDGGRKVLATCSGTLIQPQLVLTAAHCVDGEVKADEIAVYFGADATSLDDPDFRFLTFADDVDVHPDWDPEDVAAGSDLALVHLADEVPIEPARIRTSPLTDADLGRPVQLIGWGRTRGDRRDGGIKRRAVSRLDDFDDLLVRVGNDSTNTCNGDSGGPAYATAGGAEEIVGITSFGDEDCTRQGLSTRVDVFADFILGKDDLDDGDRTDGGDRAGPLLPETSLGGDGGCSAADRGRPGLLAALLVFLVLPLRRRRRIRRPPSRAVF